MGTLATLGVSDVGVREGEWLIGTVSLIIATHSDTCEEAKSALSQMSRSPALISGGKPRATDAYLLWVVCSEIGLEVLSTTLDSSS